MPVYKAVFIIEIPIKAASEAEALEYIKSNDEYFDDSSFVSKECLSRVERIYHPAQSPFEGTVGCWNSPDGDDYLVAEEFFSKVVPEYPDVDDSVSEEKRHEIWDIFVAKKDKILDSFDEIRSGKADIIMTLDLNKPT